MGFLFTADCHVSASGLKSMTPASDGFIALKQVVDMANKFKVPLVIGGDLFDKSRPPAPVFEETQRILKEVKHGLYFTQGNHDLDRSMPWVTAMASIDPSAVHLGYSPVDVGGHMLCGLDYAPSSQISEQLLQIPKCDGLVMHQALSQALSFDGAWNCDLDWVDSSKVTNVWIGDIHTQADHYSKDKKVRGTYSGSTWMQTLAESPHPVALLVGDEKDENGHYHYETHAIHHREVLSLHFESFEAFEDFMNDDSQVAALMESSYEDKPEEIRKPIVKLSYHLDEPEIREGFEGLAEGLGGVYLFESALPARGRVGILDTCPKSDRTVEKVTLGDSVARRCGSDQARSFGVDLANCATSDEVRRVIDMHRDAVFAVPTQEGEHVTEAN